MAKHNFIYQVVAYIGGLDSHETKVVYETTKQDEANAFLHKYIREHEELEKIYIERKPVNNFDKRRSYIEY